MAWLQKMAGKAEDFLNKIDKNAANVLQEPDELGESITNNVIETTYDHPTEPVAVEILEEIVKTVDDNESVTSLESEVKSVEIDVPIIIPQEIFERPFSRSSQLPSSASSSNLQDDRIKYEEQIAKLEYDNQELNKQILNIQHLYSELQMEYGCLRNEIERVNQSAEQSQNQMEQYKIRAQRILNEKEKLISVRRESGDDGDKQLQIVSDYNDELKKELQFQKDRNSELMSKVGSLQKEVGLLQQQYINIQSNNQQNSQTLQQSLMSERKFRAGAEEEFRVKCKEIQSIKLELSMQQDILKSKQAEIEQLRFQMKQQVPKSSRDVEARLHTLTETLMHKQGTLETTTTERNALKIQLEKLEVAYNQLLNQKQRTFVNIPSTNETDDVKSQVPRFMQVSPLDAGVTRRVKHAYSTLDTISIRTGVFLRRYPLARIFVFCYMILLQLWVLIILFIYMPSTR